MNSLDDLKRKEYIDSPQYWVRQHIIGKAYNVDKYTLNRFIEAIEWQITENEQLQKRFEEAKTILEWYATKMSIGFNPLETNDSHLQLTEWDGTRTMNFGHKARDFLLSLDKGE